MANEPTPSAMNYLVYQDLNDRSNVMVARGDEMVAGTFNLVAGPFDSEAEAEKEAARIRRDGAAKPHD